MIMFCINFASAGECGGNVPRVSEGNARVGWPGAPGWTTTGVSCAAIGRDSKHTSAKAGKYLITDSHSPHSLTEGAEDSSSVWTIYTASGRYSARLLCDQSTYCRGGCSGAPPRVGSPRRGRRGGGG